MRELDEIGRRLREVELVDETLSPIAWDDLQFRTDSSTERVRAYRKRQKKQSVDTVKRSETVSVTAQETDTDTDTELESSNEDSSSSDEPALSIEEVFGSFQALMRDLGLPVPRDLTPERRGLLRPRIRQYPLEDFQTVFQKCRDSPFLRGDKGRTPLKFDWLFKKGNFQKVLEGNYD
jgi:hypothetical protein